MGEEDVTIAAHTLLKEALTIKNGIEPGVTGIDYGTVTIASNTKVPITINHSLGKAPIWAALIPESARYRDDGNGTYYVAQNINGSNIEGSTNRVMNKIDATCKKETSNLTFYLVYSSTRVTFPAGKYYWFAVA